MAFDLVVKDGKIVEIGRINGAAAKETLNAEGRVVAPGFVDGHTHMDAQIFWDPIGTSSCFQGVTSVVMGNCGFTLAPCRAEVDAAGLGGEVGHVGEAVGHDPVAGREVMLGDPRRVVAQPLGFEDFIGRAGVHVAMRVGLFLRVRMGGEKDAEFHVSSSLFRCAILGTLSDQSKARTLAGRIGSGSWRLAWHSTSSSRTA